MVTRSRKQTVNPRNPNSYSEKVYDFCKREANAVFGVSSILYFYTSHLLQEQWTHQLKVTTIISNLNQLKTHLQNRQSSVPLPRLPLPSIHEFKPLTYFKIPSAQNEVRYHTEVNCIEDTVAVLTSTLQNPPPVESASVSIPSKSVSTNTNAGHSDDVYISTEGQATTDIQFFAEVDNLVEYGNRADQQKAYFMLKNNQQRFETSCGFWWRYAMATHFEAIAAGNVGDIGLKRKLTFSAFEFAEKSIKLNDKSSDAHKWFAITAGSKGDFLGVNGKIQNGFIFKEHIDLAIAINPNDPMLHHLLGRFCYDVSKLSWLEKKAASSLFSKTPTATIKDALEHFKTAENVGKPSKENRLFLAKCYIGMDDYKSTLHWLNSAAILPVLSQSDKKAEAEIAKLLSKHRKNLH